MARRFCWNQGDVGDTDFSEGERLSWRNDKNQIPRARGQIARLTGCHGVEISRAGFGIDCRESDDVVQPIGCARRDEAQRPAGFQR